MERSKKKFQLWKKATVHFFLCFIVGFFTGFIPTSDKSWTSFGHVLTSTQSDFSLKPLEIPSHHTLNRSLLDGTHLTVPLQSDELVHTETIKQEQDFGNSEPGRLIIVVTPTSAKNHLREVLLMRLANTLKLVPPPLLWVVVEQQSDTSQVSEVLRKSGVMYRHVVFENNIADLGTEMDHQRNMALNHIEHHKLSGIVHFAGLDNVYDLSFFDEIRATEVFGTWPMAFVSANRKRVIIEGPICDSSQVIGWHFKKKNNDTTTTTKSPLHISSFAFNSSILWDPERWGRPSSAHDTPQKTMKFVEKEVLEGETELKGIPAGGCSKIMLWNVHIPTKTEPHFYNSPYFSGDSQSYNISTIT